MKIILTLVIFTLANNIICAQTGYHEGLKAVQEKSKWGFQNKNRKWRKHARKVVFLGTPHHGAPLERGGHWGDLVLG